MPDFVSSTHLIVDSWGVFFQKWTTKNRMKLPKKINLKNVYDLKHITQERLYQGPYNFNGLKHIVLQTIRLFGQPVGLNLFFVMGTWESEMPKVYGCQPFRQRQPFGCLLLLP
jgi:hypothetical protein